MKKKKLFLTWLSAGLITLPLLSMARNSQQPVLNKNEEKAQVIFKLGDVSYDDSGYSLLLDTDCNTYNMLDVSINGIVLPSDMTSFHSMFEYTLPEGGSANCTSPVLKNGETDTLLVPEGRYDMLIINPSPYGEECLFYVPRVDYAAMNQISLKAGMTYEFHMYRDNFGYLLMDISRPYDMALQQLLSPVTSRGLEEEDVCVRIANEGKQDIPSGSIKMTYSVNGNPIAPETIEEIIPAGKSIDYTFKTKALLKEAGTFEIKVWGDCLGDIISTNDTLTSSVTNQGAYELPFHDDFASDSFFRAAWKVIDHNQDMMTWEWESDTLMGYHYSKGAATLPFSTSQSSDDYLVSPAIRIPAGKANMTFYYRAASRNYPERLAILYGKSSDIDKMTPIDTIHDIRNENYQIYPFNFESGKDTIYYFAFHGLSDADLLGIYIDEFRVEQGEYAGEPDLALTRILLPPSGCEMAMADVALEISNVGNDNVTDFEAYYVLQGTTDTVRQRFSTLINVGSTKTVLFTETVSFPENMTKTLNAGITPLAKESILDNNKLSINRTHYTALSQFPVNLDPSRQQIRPAEENTWQRNYDTLVAVEQGADLISHCLKLDAGSRYRISYEYMGGEMILYPVPDAYEIRVGKAYTDREGWKTIKSDDNVYSTYFLKDECMFETDEEGGEYIFAVRATEIPSNLKFCRFTVSKVVDYDVRMETFLSGASNIYPMSQLGGDREATTIVRNRGNKKISNAQVKVSCEGNVLGVASIEGIEPDSSVWVVVPFKSDMATSGNKVTWTAEVSINGMEDLNPSDNALSHTFTVSDSVMAWDGFTTEDQLSTNYEILPSEPKRYGMPFSLSTIDTLTSVTIGWCNGFNRTLEFNIHPWDPETGTLGEKLYGTTIERGPQKSYATYPMPSVILPQGNYMFSISHETSNVMGLVGDMDKDGFVYELKDGKAVRNTSWGYAVIRANFNSQGVDRKYDVGLISITKPDEMGIFTQEEPIEVKLANMGSVAMEKVKVECFINNEKLDTKEIDLAAYENKTIGFTANLSAPETRYEIMVISNFEKDPVKGNDTLVKVVNSFAAINPYRMDFEHCEEFAISDFTPAWKSIDLDGVPTSGFQDINYPGKEEATGFMVFNPYMTNPPMCGPEAAVQYEKVIPVQGYQYGVSFSSSSVMNNDWLVSPKLKLPKANASMSFYVKSYSEIEGPEQYKVLVSETGDEPTDFQVLQAATSAAAEWEKVEVDLSGYAGKEVFLAIQCITLDGFVFMIDDIRVSDPNTSVGMESESHSGINIYPNPAHSQVYIYAGESGIRHLEIYSVNGQKVMDMETGSDQESILLDIHKLKPGLYIIRIQNRNGGYSTLKMNVI